MDERPKKRKEKERKRRKLGEKQWEMLREGENR